MPSAMLGKVSKLIYIFHIHMIYSTQIYSCTINIYTFERWRVPWFHDFNERRKLNVRNWNLSCEMKWGKNEKSYKFSSFHHFILIYSGNVKINLFFKGIWNLGSNWIDFSALTFIPMERAREIDWIQGMNFQNEKTLKLLV